MAENAKYVEQRFEDFSALKFSASLYEFNDEQQQRAILALKFAGTYRIGSEGNPDAEFMRAMTIAALELWGGEAVIFDLTQLSYEWGDAIEGVFSVPAERNDEGFPVCVVTAPTCEPALRSLMDVFHDPYPNELFHPTLTAATEYLMNYLRTH